MNAKVCLLTTAYRPFDRRISPKQAKALSRAGYDAILVAQQNGPSIARCSSARSIVYPGHRSRA